MDLNTLETIMANENDQTAWLYRAVGFLMTWIGVSCILSPITTLVEMAADMVDHFAECIPGVGCIVDQMTDIFVGVVQSIVCLVSCVCAVGSFMIVVSIVWMAMRPEV